MTANAPSVSADTFFLRIPRQARRWAMLVPILCLSLFIRFLYVPDSAYRGDLAHFARWVRLISQYNVFRFYDDRLRMGVWDRAYPPLSTFIFEGVGVIYGSAPQPVVALANPNYVLLLKAVPIVSELSLIAAAYAWLINRPVLRKLIPALLAVSPGLIVTTAWWGQYDAPFTLFLVLTLIALNRDRPAWAWIFLAIGILLKQPAAVLTPLLLVVTLRRYGWQAAVQGVSLCVVIGGSMLIPFMLRTGADALSPYLNAGDAFPFWSNNAYNFWFAFATMNKGAPMYFQEKRFLDSLTFWGPLTYKEAGLLLFAASLVVVLIIAWRQAHERREFVWATLLYLGFFLFPTQVHERYLYPAAVLVLFALAQDRRMWWVALGLMMTFGYNVLAVIVPNKWKGQRFGIDTLALPTAFLNVALFLVVMRMNLLFKANSQLARDNYDRQSSVEQTSIPD